MKLVSLKILGDDFRSLTSNKLYSFNTNYRSNRLSTKILAGLNGSGKSNLLELLAEIFYYLELYHMEGTTEEYKKSKNLGFEIEYYLPSNLTGRVVDMTNENWGSDIFDEHLHIRIRKPLGELPEFSFRKTADASFFVFDYETEALLPRKIIAYSSGQNELLSNPFYKIRHHYFEELNKKEEANFNNRLFFLSYSTNFSIYIANQLLAEKEKLNHLNEIFDTEGLDSFRITINLLNYRKNPIELTKYQAERIEYLKSCATSWTERFESHKSKQHILILDYLVKDSTVKAFQSKFETPFELFKAFYELESLNIHIDPSDHRSLIRTGTKSLNISEEIPKPDPDRLAFRLEKIKIRKRLSNGETKSIYYKQLSDGEHQLNEILGSLLMVEEDGCLYLFDEPDTHFNPKWRAKLIKLFNYLAAKKNEVYNQTKTVRKHEILLTTHSPYVISDSDRNDVYLFKKTENGVSIGNPDSQTYGASIGFLNEEIFERDKSISDMADWELSEIKEEIVSSENLSDLKKKLTRFGDSIEKFDAYNLMKKIEKGDSE